MIGALRTRLTAAVDVAVAVGIVAVGVLLDPVRYAAPAGRTPTMWGKDMPEPPAGVDVLLDDGDPGSNRYLCRWSANAWFWQRDPRDIASRKHQTAMTWQFAASQARGTLVVVRTDDRP